MLIRTLPKQNMRLFFIITACSLFTFISSAQEIAKKENQDPFKVDYDTPLTLDLSEKKKEADSTDFKKKKTKKNVFFGIKTKRGFRKSKYAGKLVTEVFYYLKEYEPPAEYARDFYFYSYDKRKIVNSLRIKDPKRIRVLHGPYTKMLGDQLLESGWYYKGMKHRRWVRFNKHDILQDKKYWWKGWAQESKLAHYDFKKTKIKEIIPMHYKEKEGEYWAFHENGQTAARGKFKFDYKVGTWKEYYPSKQIKREVVYPEDPFDKLKKPYILHEWDRKGKLIYSVKKH